MCSIHMVQATHTTLPFKAALSLRSTHVKRCLHSVRCSSNHERPSERFSTGHLLTLAASIAPLLIPLQAFSEDQVTLADAGIPSSETVSIATVALPAVAFGVATLVQQAKQANEDKALRLKAISKHKTFLSTQEDDELTEATSPMANTVVNSSGGSLQSSTSSSDKPDAAAPAMLDQPDRPEPHVPTTDEKAGSSQASDTDKQSNLPPQTAVLDRPERQEPEISRDDASSAQSSLTQQAGTFAFSSAGQIDFARPSSPGNQEEAATRDVEYQAKMKALRGKGFPSLPARQPPEETQGTNMAAEYASKLAALHKESAARAQTETRKRQERYALLANLQAQAQMQMDASKLVQTQSSQGIASQAQKLLIGSMAFLLRPLQWLVALAQKITGEQQEARQQSASA